MAMLIIPRCGAIKKCIYKKKRTPLSIYSLVYYKIRHKAKTAYGQDTIKSLKHTCTL